MKVATLAFVAAYFAVQAEAGLPDAGRMEKLKAAARKFKARKLGYSYGGNTYTDGGYIANPSRSAIERANNAGALTRSEYNRLTNRDEDDELGGYPNCDSSPDCSRGRRRLEMAKKSASKGKEAAKKSAGTQKKKGDDAKKSAKKETAVKKQTESA